MKEGELRGIILEKEPTQSTHISIELPGMGVKRGSCSSCNTQDSLCWHVITILLDPHVTIYLLEKTLRKYCIIEELSSKRFKKKKKRENP